LISALQKLGAKPTYTHDRTFSINLGALHREAIFRSGMLSSLFSTHPPLEDRIAALREMSVTPRAITIFGEILRTSAFLKRNFSKIYIPRVPPPPCHST